MWLLKYTQHSECFSLFWPFLTAVWTCRFILDCVKKHSIMGGSAECLVIFIKRSLRSPLCKAHSRVPKCVCSRPPWIISRPGQGPISHPLYLANLSTEPVPCLWIERKRKGSWSAQTSRASAVAAVTQFTLPTLWSHTPGLPGPLAGPYPLHMDPGPLQWQQFEPIWDYRLDSINPASRPSYGSMTNLSIFLL